MKQCILSCIFFIVLYAALYGSEQFKAIPLSNIIDPKSVCYISEKEFVFAGEKRCWRMNEVLSLIPIENIIDIATDQTREHITLLCPKRLSIYNLATKEIVQEYSIDGKKITSLEWQPSPTIIALETTETKNIIRLYIPFNKTLANAVLTYCIPRAILFGLQIDTMHNIFDTVIEEIKGISIILDAMQEKRSYKNCNKAYCSPTKNMIAIMDSVALHCTLYDRELNKSYNIKTINGESITIKNISFNTQGILAILYLTTEYHNTSPLLKLKQRQFSLKLMFQKNFSEKTITDSNLQSSFVKTIESESKLLDHFAIDFSPSGTNLAILCSKKIIDIPVPKEIFKQ